MEINCARISNVWCEAFQFGKISAVLLNNEWSEMKMFAQFLAFILLTPLASAKSARPGRLCVKLANFHYGQNSHYVNINITFSNESFLFADVSTLRSISNPLWNLDASRWNFGKETKVFANWTLRACDISRFAYRNPFVNAFRSLISSMSNMSLACPFPANKFLVAVEYKLLQQALPLRLFYKPGTVFILNHRFLDNKECEAFQFGKISAVLLNNEWSEMKMFAQFLAFILLTPLASAKSARPGRLCVKLANFHYGQNSHYVNINITFSNESFLFADVSTLRSISNPLWNLDASRWNFGKETKVFANWTLRACDISRFAYRNPFVNAFRSLISSMSNMSLACPFPANKFLVAVEYKLLQQALPLRLFYKPVSCKVDFKPIINPSVLHQSETWKPLNISTQTIRYTVKDKETQVKSDSIGFFYLTSGVFKGEI
ncbi:unnamed protein product [Hermetia illucens]|uniref:Uncharacterized protein n=1 Tax=Hermetia illucens TaxID=343691 RepID=A0A7R8V783_HERIL|nr:unnamed protein product [Hermetia illucens]